MFQHKANFICKIICSNKNSLQQYNVLNIIDTN